MCVCKTRKHYHLASNLADSLDYRTSFVVSYNIRTFPNPSQSSTCTEHRSIPTSVAEPPLFWAAPAPDGQGPGADSGSDLLGSAPAPGKKRWPRLHTLKFLILSFQQFNY